MKRTKQFCLMAALAVPSFAFAQQSANPFTAGEKGFFGYVSSQVIAAAEEVPESDYAFKPTAEVRSFGQLVGHVADAQYMFCSMVGGETNPSKGAEKSQTAKSDLVQSLKDAGAYCTKVYGGLTDAQGAQTIKFMGRDMAKLTVLTINSAHTDEHYGNMVTYMRLKGLVPPTSKPRK
jgi:uncharacterized damage-inducible protein DinB